MIKGKIYFKNLLELYNKITIAKLIAITFILISIIDIMNIPTVIYNFGSLSLILGILILIIFTFIELYLKDLVLLKTVNYFDLCIIVLFFTSIIYFINYSIFEFPTNIYKNYLLLSVIILSLLSIILRYLYINHNSKKKDYKSNIIDLKDAYENNFPNDSNALYFIDESPVEYDLLERNEIISTLYNNIKECRTQHQYVIGLTGAWGSGKTTIINNVKKYIKDSEDNDLIVIDTFNPWIYENKSAMFQAMFDILLSKIGLKFSIVEINKYINYLTNIIFGYTNLDKFKFSKRESQEIQRIKNIINNYLIENNKRIVFIIDNIERTNKDNILLLLKSVFSIFNFDRIIYIISFDKERMKKIFNQSLDTDYEYIEKIIQNELEVPRISKEQICDINYRVINNILNAYGVSEEERNNLKEIINEYSRNIKDLRDLKRNINSIISCNFINNNYLNKIDSFIIKFISLKNPELINQIYNNRKYFVSEDYTIYQDDYEFNTEKYNKDADEFFKKLFTENNRKYIDLLKICFPNVKIYNDKYTSDTLPSYRWTGGFISYDKSNYYITNKNKRIYDGKFFDLYFTNSKNEFLEIDISINKFLNIINNNCNQKDIDEAYKNLLNIYTNFVQKYILETLQYYLDDIKQNIFRLTLSIYNNIRYCDDTLLFFGGLSSKSRAELIVADLLCKLTNDEFEKFLSYINTDYKNLYIIREINYWLKPENRHSQIINEEYYNKFLKNYENMKQNIKDNKINIYSDNNYGIHNIYCFWDDEEYINSVNKIINKKTVFKFLADMIGTSVSNVYGYTLKKDDINKIIDINKLDSIIQKNDTLSEKENFIYQVFINSKKEKGIMDDHDLECKEPFKFDLSK